jgi:hypothetical protein
MVVANRLNTRVRNLSIVIQDVDVALAEYELEIQQKTDLQKLATSCENVLTDVVKTTSKYNELDSSRGTLSMKSKRIWKGFEWEPDDIRELRDRITSNVTMLNAIVGRISRYLFTSF